MKEYIILNFIDVDAGKEVPVEYSGENTAVALASTIDLHLTKHPGHVLTSVVVRDVKPSVVTITCYNETKTWFRDDALAFYQAGVESCDGAERQRYMNIVSQLLRGETECSDQRR